MEYLKKKIAVTLLQEYMFLYFPVQSNGLSSSQEGWYNNEVCRQWTSCDPRQFSSILPKFAVKSRLYGVAMEKIR